MNRFASVRDVILALGGTEAVAKMFNVTSQAVSVWRVRNALPPHTFPTISQELLKRGLAADLSLWRWDRKRKAVGE
jgi:hypothetical protein